MEGFGLPALHICTTLTFVLMEPASSESCRVSSDNEEDSSTLQAPRTRDSIENDTFLIARVLTNQSKEASSSNPTPYSRHQAPQARTEKLQNTSMQIASYREEASASGSHVNRKSSCHESSTEAPTSTHAASKPSMDDPESIFDAASMIAALSGGSMRAPTSSEIPTSAMYSKGGKALSTNTVTTAANGSKLATGNGLEGDESSNPNNSNEKDPTGKQCAERNHHRKVNRYRGAYRDKRDEEACKYYAQITLPSERIGGACKRRRLALGLHATAEAAARAYDTAAVSGGGKKIETFYCL